MILLTGALLTYPVFSALTSSVTIQSSGKIIFPTITAASGSAADIQVAVDYVVATGGVGSVYIPEGTWNFVNVGESWTGSKVIVPEGVSIFGAPNERDSAGQCLSWKTVLVLPWDMPGSYGSIPTWFTFVGDGDDNMQSRFSDIKLVGYRSVDSNSVELYHPLVIIDCVNYRVDHCYFENTPSGVYTFGSYTSKNAGVFDHNYFVNTNGLVVDAIADCTVTYGIQVGRDWGDYWEEDITQVFGQYTEYSVYIEDCYFEKWRHCVSSNDGAHYVMRYCTIQDDYGYGSLDAHAWYQTSGGSITQVGTRAVEIYCNTITNAISSPWGVAIRGGSGVSFNNTFGGGTYTFFMYLRNDMRSNSEASFVWCNDWYIWDNTLLSGASLFTKYDPDNQIVEEVNYHFNAPDSFTYVPYQYPHPLTVE